MENMFLIYLFAVLVVIITKPITVLFHELGHAIPAILLTRKSVSIYIGSYGDPENSWHFRFGLLEFWFKRNPLSWKLGLCVPSDKQMSINKQIIFILTGPMASLSIAVISCYFAFTYDLHGLLKLILTVFLVSSILDLYLNLTPSSKPIKLHDGRLAYNDGYRLKQLLHASKFPKEYNEAIGLYGEQKFEEAAKLFHQILKNGLQTDHIYRLAISAYLQSKNFPVAMELNEAFILDYKLNSDDFSNAGYLYSQLGEHEKALEFYENSLKLNSSNTFSLNNKGYTLNVFEKYLEAIPLFDKVIEVDKDFAHAYNNRGLSKIKTGKLEEGLLDINHSMMLDKNNSYAYCNLGIYHSEKGETKIALDYFRKARELDKTTYNIDQLIQEMEKKIGKNMENEE